MKQLISILLIFSLIFPALILTYSTNAYTFAGLESNSTFSKILKSLLALFFLDKLFNLNTKETMTDSENKDDTELKLSWKDKEVKDLTIAEEKMLNLINGARKKKKLKPLKIDHRLMKIAREKCRDMIRNDYFSHQSPTYGSPFNMFRTLDIDYYLAGENIAGAKEVEFAHQELMASKKHKDNILDPNFTHLGIGVITGGPYGKMFVQEFADLKE